MKLFISTSAYKGKGGPGFKGKGPHPSLRQSAEIDEELELAQDEANAHRRFKAKRPPIGKMNPKQGPNRTAQPTKDLPEWLASMSEQHRADYFAEHPNSRYRK